MKQVATLWGVWILWVWVCVTLGGCVTSKTVQFDPVTGNKIFESKATGTGSKVVEAQKALKVVNADGSGIDMTAGIQGMDSATAMMTGMRMSRDIGQTYISAWSKLRMKELEDPQPDSDALSFLSSEERALLLNFLTTRAASP